MSHCPLKLSSMTHYSSTPTNKFSSCVAEVLEIILVILFLFLSLYLVLIYPTIIIQQKMKIRCNQRVVNVREWERKQQSFDMLRNDFRSSSVISIPTSLNYISGRFALPDRSRNKRALIGQNRCSNNKCANNSLFDRGSFFFFTWGIVNNSISSCGEKIASLKSFLSAKSLLFTYLSVVDFFHQRREQKRKYKG